MEEDGVIFNVMIPLEVGFYFFFPFCAAFFSRVTSTMMTLLTSTTPKPKLPWAILVKLKRYVFTFFKKQQWKCFPHTPLFPSFSLSLHLHVG